MNDTSSLKGLCQSCNKSTQVLIQCPTCKDLQLNLGYYCSQDCLENNSKTHLLYCNHHNIVDDHHFVPLLHESVEIKLIPLMKKIAPCFLHQSDQNILTGCSSTFLFCAYCLTPPPNKFVESLSKDMEKKLRNKNSWTDKVINFKKNITHNDIYCALFSCMVTFGDSSTHYFTLTKQNNTIRLYQSYTDFYSLRDWLLNPKSVNNERSILQDVMTLEKFEQEFLAKFSQLESLSIYNDKAAIKAIWKELFFAEAGDFVHEFKLAFWTGRMYSPENLVEYYQRISIKNNNNNNKNNKNSNIQDTGQIYCAGCKLDRARSEFSPGQLKKQDKKCIYCAKLPQLPTNSKTKGNKGR
jgi:hypothetical protein